MQWSDYKPHQYARCAECTLREQPGPCLGEGDPRTARMAYISEKPGKGEVDARPMRPMQGGAGRVFNRQLAEAGVPRGSLYITNIVKCLCPDNREPTAHEIACCAPLLERELQRLRTDVVILSGSVAFSTIVGKRSCLSPDYHPSDALFERLGCVEQLDGKRYIATVNPAFIMKMSDTPFKQEAVEHLKKAAALVGVETPMPVVIEHPTQEDIERHRSAALSNKLFADDIEAVGYTTETTEDEYVGDMRYVMDICGFSAVPYEAIVLDKEQLYDAWHDIWARPDVVQAEHNGESDRAHLEQVAPQLNRRFDTMYAHHMLHSNIYKYLKPECVRLYTNLPYYNHDLAKVNRRLYNGMDCITTLHTARRQSHLMRNDTYTERDGTLVVGRLWDLYWGTAFPGEPGMGEILPLLEEQRRIGDRVDKRRWLYMYRILSKMAEDAKAAITELIGPTFNWQSYGPGGDVQRLFYMRWGLPKQYKKNQNHERRVTCDKDARARLREWINATPDRRASHEEAAHYFDLVDDASKADTYLEFLDRLQPDGRVHAFWKAHNGDLFRIQSKPNLQNFPEEGVLEVAIPDTCPHCHTPTYGSFTQVSGHGLTTYTCKHCEGLFGYGTCSIRSLLIPDTDDDITLSADYGQAELWPYAEYFQIRWLLDVAKSGDYIYGRAYEDLMKKPFFVPNIPPGVPKTKKLMRQDVSYQALRRAKMAPLGYLYGRTPESVAEQYRVPLWEVKENQKGWLGLNPELPKAHEWIKYQMEQKGRLRPPPGLLVHYPKPDLQGLAAFGQTPAAYTLITSMILIDREFKRQHLERTRICRTMHDSLAINIGNGRIEPEKVRHVAETIVKPILTRPCAWINNFRYTCSMNVGTMWDWEMVDYDKWIKCAGQNNPG